MGCFSESKFPLGLLGVEISALGKKIGEIETAFLEILRIWDISGVC